MINILITVDENYMKHLFVMLVSLYENTSSKVKIHCIFSENVQNDSISKLKKIIDNYGGELQIYKIENYPELLNKIKTLKVGNHFKYSMYFRLFGDIILDKKVDKILYLDPDIIINSDIWELYNENLDNYYIGAVVEDYKKLNIKRLKLNKEYYYNSGVLLINILKMRKNNTSYEILNFINTIDFGTIMYPDQDIINMYFKEKEIMKLDSLWNVHNEYLKKRNYKVDNFKIIHFTGSNKPWNYTNLHPYKKYYFNYLKKISNEKYTYNDKNWKTILKKILKIMLLKKI